MENLLRDTFILMHPWWLVFGRLYLDGDGDDDDDDDDDDADGNG